MTMLPHHRCSLGTDCLVTKSCAFVSDGNDADVFSHSLVDFWLRATLAMCIPVKIDRRGKANSSHQIQEARISTQRIQTWIHVGIDHPLDTRIVRFFKPAKRFVSVA